MATARPPGADATPREADLPVWGGPADLLRYLLGWAVLAPSRHNAQPWLFEVQGDEARVYADRWRALPAVDPRDRELKMACGAALLNLRLAAAHFGWATSHEIVAGGRRDGMLARLRLEERRPPAPDDEELFRAIPRRRTCRLPLEGRDPPAGLVARLARDAAEEGAVLRPVDDAERAAVAELVAEGDRRQWADGSVRAEHARWTRTGGSSRRDGMPAWSLGLSDAAAILQPLWQAVSDPGAVEAERDRRRVAGARVLLCLGSRGDHPADHVAAGQALQRVLLRAAGAGLAACYLGSPVEVPELAFRLRDALGMRAFPQALFRLGYGGTLRPTPRRPVDEVVRRIEALPPPPEVLAVARAPAGEGEARRR